jgi:Pregnancy-associated plasma protein-A/GEVED domain
MKKTILLNGGILLLFFIFSIHVSAQKKGEDEVGRICNTSKMYDELLKSDPEFAARVAENEKALQAYVKAHPNGRPSATQAPLLTLPLMIHIMDPDGSALYNPTTTDINNMITFLNQGFRNTIANACGVDVEVQFQLAVRKPDCTTTTGIDTHSMSGNATYVAGGVGVGGITDASLKATHQFDPSSYINIWIVNKIDGVDGNGGGPYTAGYATYPSGTPAVDGIVMLAKEVRSSTPISTSTSRTLIHEMGHYLNLPHTFNGDGSLSSPFVANQCPSNADCTVDGDKVCDTEPYYLPNNGSAITFSCTAPATNTCTGAAFVANGSGCTVLNNYMSYAFNSCQRMFTDGQKTRMRAAINTLRPGLLSSLALTAATTPVTAGCAVTASNGVGAANYYGLINVTLNDLNYSSGYSKQDGQNYIDRTCVQKATVVAGSTYSMSINGGANSECRNVYIDWNNDGDFTDAGEQVLTNVLGANAQSTNIVIPNAGSLNSPHRMRVVVDPVCSGPCNLTGNGTTFGSGQAEDFLLDVTMNPMPVNLLSFTATPKDNRTVEIRWETATEENSDFFVIERSENLKSFENVAKVKSGGNTSERRSYSAIDNNPTVGTNYYRLKEFATSGNPRVYAPVAVNVDANNAGTIIYPNPNNGTFVVSLPDNMSEMATFKLSTILGTDLTLQAEKAGAGQFKLKATNRLAVGVYMLTVQTNSTVRNLKVIVQE